MQAGRHAGTQADTHASRHASRHARAHRPYRAGQEELGGGQQRDVRHASPGPAEHAHAAESVDDEQELDRMIAAIAIPPTAHAGARTRGMSGHRTQDSTRQSRAHLSGQSSGRSIWTSKVSPTPMQVEKSPSTACSAQASQSPSSQPRSATPAKHTTDRQSETGTGAGRCQPSSSGREKGCGNKDASCNQQARCSPSSCDSSSITRIVMASKFWAMLLFDQLSAPCCCMSVDSPAMHTRYTVSLRPRGGGGEETAVEPREKRKQRRREKLAPFVCAQLEAR
jgi:hypothetical protein